MYCTLAELKSYLGVATATDDTLLNALISAAQQRINDVTRRNFEATADTLRYYSAEDADGRCLELYADLSYITSVTVDGSPLPSTEYTVDPRNVTPWQRLVMKSSSVYTWGAYSSAPEDSVTITGRWAAMHSKAISAISRASNVVTATVGDTEGLNVGSNVNIAGVADTSFNGSFVLTAVTDTTVTWAQTAANDTDTTGTLLFTPASIRQACTRLAAFLYRQKDNQAGDSDRAVVGPTGIIMPIALPADVQSLLQPWVKIR